MKSFVSVASFVLIFFTSCKQTTEENAVEPDEFTSFRALIQQNTRLQTALGALIQFTNDIMDKAKVNGRISAETGEVPTCATIQPDLKSKTLTVDFSGGCSSPYGTVKGSITISYTGAFGQSGASVTVRMNNFAVGDFALSGTVGMTDFKKTGTNLLEYKVKLTEVSAVYQGAALRTTMDMGQSWKNYQTTSSGDDEIVTSLKGNYFIDDLNYDVETTTNLLVKGTCSSNVAESGIMKMVAKGMTAVLDYGVGNCDLIGTLTIGNQSKSIDLR